MAILITGAGLIGRHVARGLAERGETVLLLDRRLPAAGAVPPGVRLIAGDINDAAFMADLIRGNGVDRVAHTAAALAVAARENPPMAVQTNILASVQLLELARQGAIGRLVLTSSGSINYSVFGSSDGTPIAEDFQARVLSEGPGSFYIATKLAMEHFCQLYRNNYGVSATALRLGAVLGAATWDDVSLVARLGLTVVEAARRGLPLAIEDQMFLWEETEEFIDPRDAADGVIAALFADDLPQPVYNIAAADAVSIEQFMDRARAALPGLETHIPVRPKAGFMNFPHPRKSRTDISAAARDLGFVPQHDVGAALAYMNAHLPALPTPE